MREYALQSEVKMKATGLFSGRNLISSLILFLAAYLVIQGGWIGAAAVSAASGGAPLPDMSFSYDPADLPAMFAALGEVGRAAYLSMNAFDFFFAGAYGAFYFIALGWIATKLFPKARALRFIGFVGVLGALCDEIENVVFKLAASGRDISDPVSALASFATTAKFSLIAAAMALTVAGFIGLITVMIARRKAR